MTKKRVLLGVDADSLFTAIDLFSNGTKFDVTVAHEGDEAVRAMIEKAPDLAILDIDLAGRGGDECCKKMKEAALSPATLVVLLVSFEKQGDIGRCLDAKCDAILLKPLTYEQLSGLVTRLLFWDMRIASRFLVRIPVQYGVQPHKMTENLSIDLTTRGIFLEAQETIPVGTPLQVAFTLPHSSATAIRCTARVAWQNDPMLRRESLLPPGIGLEFVDIDKSQVDAIREFLCSQEWLLKGGNQVLKGA